jgi:hypothetical protein
MNTSTPTAIELQQLSLLKDRVHYAWEQLKLLLEQEQIQYNEYTDKMACDAGFELVKGRELVPFLYRVIPERDLIEFSALIVENFDENRLHETMLLACHFNELLRNGVVEVRIRPKRVFFRNVLTLKDLILEPDALVDAFYSHMLIAQDIKEGYIKLIEEHEEPVVIIGEMIKKDRERHA